MGRYVFEDTYTARYEIEADNIHEARQKAGQVDTFSDLMFCDTELVELDGEIIV